MTAAWRDSRLLVLDTETTGINVDTARIVTICYGHVGGGALPDINHHLINPGIDLPAEATAVHGITTEHAHINGLDPADVLATALDAIETSWAQGIPLVAFNAAYDLTVLDREARRHLGHGLPPIGNVIDPYVIDRELDRYRKGNRTLAAMCAHYNVALDGAHDAEADAIAAGRLAWRLAGAFPQLADMTLEQLHTAQVDWHATRQADFADYLRRTGKDAGDVDGSWPMRAAAGPVAA